MNGNVNQMTRLERLTREGYDIAYSETEGNSPCVVFCGGFNSSMQGNKPLALERFCEQLGIAFIRFDYAGHGSSGGDFADSGISRWLGDTLEIIDYCAQEKIILVGSSMGGWLSLLAAVRRPTKIAALVLLACAVDMTKYYPANIQDLLKQQDDQGRTFYQVNNTYGDQEPYKVYQQLIDDGKQYYLLDSDIELDIPIHIMHGMQDDVIPPERVERLIDRLTSPNIVTHFIEQGDHRLSRHSDIESIGEIINSLRRLIVA